MEERKEKWVSLFEKVVGRKPTPDEFLKGRETDFDLKAIRQITGLDQLENSASLSDRAIQMNVTPGTAPTPATWSKGKKFLWAGIALLAIAGFSAYTYFSSQSGPKVAVEAFSKAASRNDFEALAKLLSHGSDKWTKEEVRGFLAYLSEKKINPVEVLESFVDDPEAAIYSDDQGNKLLGLEEDGKTLGIFTNYRVTSFPLTISVKSNLSDLEIDGQKVEKDKEIALPEKRFTPQSLKVIAKTDIGQVSSNFDIYLEDVSDNHLLIELEEQEVTISANLPSQVSNATNPKLVVNGKNLGTGLTAETKLLSGQELTVHAVFTYEGQELTTEKSQVTFDDEKSNIHLDLTLSSDILSKIKEIEADKSARKAKEELDAANAAKESELKAEVEELVFAYRNAINDAIANRNPSAISNLFTSSSNSTYLEIKDDILPELWSNGLSRYDSTTTGIVINSVEGDIIRATVTSSVISHYKNGKSSGPSTVVREYTMRRIGQSLYFESFNTN